MTTATAVKQNTAISIERANLFAPILFATGREWIGIYAGTKLRIGDHTHTFAEDVSLAVSGTLLPGYDYGVRLNDLGKPSVDILNSLDRIGSEFFAGFHFAHSGCAEGKDGGDGTAAINPFSIWDLGFRPSCNDPRGMALVDGRFWADIYLLGVDHGHGTSCCGAMIADGRDLPERPGGDGKAQRLDYATAVEIYKHHGKRLLGAEEFFAAAYGVKERCSRDDDPARAGSLADDGKRFISKWGLFDATGTMWQWGTDGHPDDPRPSIFGGSWVSGSSAGSRYARLGYWAEGSSGSFSARGASDHLSPV